MVEMMRKFKEYGCKRCAHSWLGREQEPRVCPLCHSPYWNMEKKFYYDWERAHKKQVKV